MYFYHIYNVASDSDITPHIKIDKPLVVYIFSNVMYHVYINVAYITAIFTPKTKFQSNLMSYDKKFNI